MGRILGIDYGSKRVGLAVTDDLRIIASPLIVLQNDDRLLLNLAQICEEYGVDQIVLGLPLSDKYHEAENAVRAFSEKLGEAVLIPIEFQDETLSSVYSENLMRMVGAKKKKKDNELDKYAAQKILSDYLGKNG